MKKLTYILLTLLFVGCQDFLDRDPIIETEPDAESLVNAAYAALQFELTPAAHFRWFWGDIMSDDSEKGGSGPNDGFEISQLENFQAVANNEPVESEWKANFQGIYRANYALENIAAMEMDETLKSRLLAEAKTLRAWYYFSLVRMYGGVPIADRVLAPSEYNLPRNSADEVWAFVIQDLTEAIPDLPKRSEYTLNDLGRMTQGTAQAILAKAYLWQQNWEGARQATADIISSGEYELEEDFASIFTLAGENGSGSVFEIQFMQNSGGNWGENNGNEGTLSNVFQRARGQFEGYGFNIPTQDLVDAFFEENPMVEDPRLVATVFREGEAMGDRGIFTKEATGDFPHDYYNKKLFNNKSEEASFGDPNPNGGSNDRVIRYADVLLMHAEAAYHTGDESSARNSLNMVRARARGAATNILFDVTASGNDLLEAIYHERRVELAMEGHRFFDLVRTGRATAELGALGYTEGKHNLFPIPESQIQATNGAITQNPGY